MGAPDDWHHTATCHGIVARGNESHVHRAAARGLVSQTIGARKRCALLSLILPQRSKSRRHVAWMTGRSATVPRKAVIANLAQWFTGSADHPRPTRERLTRVAFALVLALLPIALIVSSVAANVPGRKAGKTASATIAPAVNTATSATARQTQTVHTPSSPTPNSKPAAGGPTATPAPSSHMVFADEFNGTSLDTTKWIVMNRPGDASNLEQECFTPNNVTEKAGNLVITSALDASCSGYKYTSGMVQTRSFNFQYGTVEIRAKMPHGQGMWPALWLLGANCQSTTPITPDNTGPCQWPTPGSDEVDILELKGQDPNTDYMTAVYGSVPNQANYPQCTYTGPDFSQDFHIFSLNWTPGKLTWYVDGVQRCTQAVGVPSHPLFLILNSAVGGGFVGAPDNSIFPQVHVIDYVRVYQ
jgi:beta-glucanase (GH16 family)